MSEKLLKARRAEEEKKAMIPKEQRPVFHFSVPCGWMNDPNGFSVYRGEYHLFFQYNPYDIHWDAMHWGHAKTRDFIKWDYLPAALAPDQEYDSFGVFSGGAVEGEDKKQYLMYTGVRETKLPDGTAKIFQNQCIAVGDGINYEKIDANPVVTADMLPEGSSLEDFRDPKLWKEDGIYYMAAGSRSSDGSGQIALFASENLLQWKFLSILDRSENKLGRMWECPDFFSLGDKGVLVISPQEMDAKGLEIHNGNNNLFLIGTYKKAENQFVRETVSPCDYGLDFYAAQTMETEDKRRILIAWMQNWDNHMPLPGFLWSGMMTVPRELSLKDGRIIQQPVRELERYRRNPISCEKVAVEGSRVLPGVSGEAVDMTVRLLDGDYDQFEIRLAGDKEHYCRIVYRREEEILSFDRTYSGYKRDVISTRSMKVGEKDGKLKLRILLDKYSCEIFANDGEKVMTCLIPNTRHGGEIEFMSRGKAIISVDKFDIDTEDGDKR